MRQTDVVRYLLGILLTFGALNAFGGGVYGLAGAQDVPVEWLRGSPFTDYTVPSLILLFVVGGSLMTAAVAVIASARLARAWALASGAIVLCWISVQVSIIGFVSWMQPATAVGGALILLLALGQPSERRRQPN